MNSSLRRYLLLPLILLSAHAFAANESGAKSFNVRDFGAAGNGQTLDSPAINKAIEAASSAGGGKVIVPEGKYLSGTIRMKSDIDLHLEKGAVIVADKWDSQSYDPTEFFTPPAYQDGGHTYFHNSLIRGENLTNVSITGEGMIDGSGLTTYKGELNKKLGFGKGSEGNGAGAPVGADTPTYAANKAIALKLCKKINISGISILRGGWFAILLTGCDDIVLQDLTIDTNRDGMDIDGCVNVVVKNCKVNSPEDDGICPKSTCALGQPRVTEKLLIEDCQVSGFAVGTLLDGTRQPDPKDHRCGRIKFGTESSGGFRDCKVNNCTFLSCAGFALEEVDGGIIENISVSNLKMENPKNYVLYIVTGNRDRTPNLTTKSRMKNVTISDVTAEGADIMSGIQIFGMADQPIENLSLANIRIAAKGGGTDADAARVPKDLGKQYPDPSGKGNMPAYGIFARHVKDLKLSNLDFTQQSPDRRPVAQFENIHGLVADNVKGQVAEGVRFAKFGPDVTGIQISNSPELEKSR